MTTQQQKGSVDLPGGEPGKVRRIVVCLCGSTRFRAEIAEANRAATMAGKIVLAPGVFGHSGDPLTDGDKRRLDELHFRKIDMADEVQVVNPGGYIGDSTRREIDYATRTGKPVSYTHTTQEQRENAIELTRAANTPDAPTPETDAEFKRIYSRSHYMCTIDVQTAERFARRLERERDALRHKLADLQSSHDAAWTRFNETDAAYQAALEQRDQYRSALDAISLRHPGPGGVGDIARKAMREVAQ